jgi:hypothetical protein
MWTSGRFWRIMRGSAARVASREGIEMQQHMHTATVPTRARATVVAGPLGGIGSPEVTVHVASTGRHVYHADLGHCPRHDPGLAYFPVEVMSDGHPRRLTLLAPGGWRTFRRCRSCAPAGVGARFGRAGDHSPRQGVGVLAWKPWL